MLTNRWIDVDAPTAHLSSGGCRGPGGEGDIGVVGLGVCSEEHATGVPDRGGVSTANAESLAARFAAGSCCCCSCSVAAASGSADVARRMLLSYCTGAPRCCQISWIHTSHGCCCSSTC